MSVSARVPLLAAALAVCLALFAALQAPGLAFHSEDQLRMVAPAELAEVEAPLVLRWKVSDEVARAVAQRRAYFAVFIDRAPIAPGESLAALADDGCRRTPGCPDRAWLAERRVLVTQSSAVRVGILPDGGWGADGRGHEATVVVIAADGTRWGEAAAGVRFLSPEESA